MKIWLQSGSAGIDPTAAKYEESLLRRLKQVARADTVVTLHGPEKPLPVRDRYLASHQLKNVNSIKYAFQAEKEGYDAFASTAHGDPAYDAIREVVQIPVTFMTETALHVACLLGPKFGFICHSDIQLSIVTEAAEWYGLEGHMVPGSYLALTYREFNKMYADPQPYVDIITRAAKEVVERGANTIILTGNPLGMFMLDQGVRELHGVPVLDSFGALVKVTELMVDLGKIGISRKLFGPHGVPSPDELAAMRKAFGVD